MVNHELLKNDMLTMVTYCLQYVWFSLMDDGTLEIVLVIIKIRRWLSQMVISKKKKLQYLQYTSITSKAIYCFTTDKHPLRTIKGFCQT